MIPLAAEAKIEVQGDEITMWQDDRKYRVRGLGKNTSYEVMKINVLVARQEEFHVDTFDMHLDRQRAVFIKRAAYQYDGDGHRVRTDQNGVTTVFIYDAVGRLIAEYSTATPPASGTKYLTADHLGSARVVTDSSGTVVSRHDYLPSGDEIAASINNRTTIGNYAAIDGTRQKFTGKERDVESGLDFLETRYLSAAQGRFNSPDPVFASMS